MKIFKENFFALKICRGSIVPTKIILHEIFLHASTLEEPTVLAASFVTFKKQLLVLVCMECSEEWL